MEVRRPLSSICRGTGTYSAEVVVSPLPHNIDYHVPSSYNVYGKSFKLPEIKKPVKAIPKTYVTRRGALLLFADSYRIWRQSFGQEHDEFGVNEKKDMVKILKTLKELRKLVLCLGLDDDYAIKGMSAILHDSSSHQNHGLSQNQNGYSKVRLWHPKLVDKYLDGDGVNKTLVQKYFELLLPDVTVDGVILKNTLFGSNPIKYSKSKLDPLKSCSKCSHNRGDVSDGDICKKPKVMVLPRIDVTQVAELTSSHGKEESLHKKNIGNRIVDQSQKKFWSNYETLTYDEKADLLYRMLTSRDKNNCADNGKLSSTYLQKESLRSRKCVFPHIKIEESAPLEKVPKCNKQKKNENLLELPPIASIKAKAKKLVSKDEHICPMKHVVSPILSTSGRISTDVGSPVSRRLPKFVYQPSKLTSHGISHSDQFLTRNRSTYIHGKHLCIKGTSLSSKGNVIGSYDEPFYADRPSNFSSSSSSRRSDLCSFGGGYSNLSSVSNGESVSSLSVQSNSENYYAVSYEFDKQDDYNNIDGSIGDNFDREECSVANSDRSFGDDSSSAQHYSSRKTSVQLESSFCTNESVHASMLKKCDPKSDVSFSMGSSLLSMTLGGGTNSLSSISKRSDVSKKSMPESNVSSTICKSNRDDMPAKIAIESDVLYATDDSERVNMSAKLPIESDSTLIPGINQISDVMAVETKSSLSSTHTFSPIKTDIDSSFDIKQINVDSDKSIITPLISSAANEFMMMNDNLLISENGESVVRDVVTNKEIEKIPMPTLKGTLVKSDVSLNNVIVDFTPENVSADFSIKSNNQDCPPVDVAPGSHTNHEGGGKSSNETDDVLLENVVTLSNQEFKPSLPIPDEQEMDILIPFTDILTDIPANLETAVNLHEQSYKTDAKTDSLSSDNTVMIESDTPSREGGMQISVIGDNSAVALNESVDSETLTSVAEGDNHKIEEVDDNQDRNSLIRKEFDKNWSGKDVNISVETPSSEVHDQLAAVVHEVLSRPGSGMNLDRDLKAMDEILKYQISTEVPDNSNSSSVEQCNDVDERVSASNLDDSTAGTNTNGDLVEEDRTIDCDTAAANIVLMIDKPESLLEEKLAEEIPSCASEEKLLVKKATCISEEKEVDKTSLASHEKEREETPKPVLEEKIRIETPLSALEQKKEGEISNDGSKEEYPIIILEDKSPEETSRSSSEEKMKEESPKLELPFLTGNLAEEKLNFLGSESKNDVNEKESVEKKKLGPKKIKESKKHANKNKALPLKKSHKKVKVEHGLEEKDSAETNVAELNQQLQQNSKAKISLLKTPPPREEKNELNEKFVESIEKSKENEEIVDMKSSSPLIPQRDEQLHSIDDDTFSAVADRSRSSSSDEFVISRSPIDDNVEIKVTDEVEEKQHEIKVTNEVKEKQSVGTVEVKGVTEPEKLSTKQIKRQQSAEARRALVENKRKLEEKRRREKEEKMRETELYVLQAQEEERRKEQVRFEMEEEIRKQEEARKKAIEVEKKRIEDEEFKKRMQEDKAEKLRMKRLADEEARRKKMEIFQAERQMELEFKKAQDEMAKAIEADMIEKEKVLMEQMEAEERKLYEAEKKLEEALRQAEDEERARRIEVRRKEEEERREKELEGLSELESKQKFNDDLQKTDRLLQIQQEITKAYTYSYFNLLPIILYGSDKFPLKIIQKAPADLSDLLRKMETISDGDKS